MPTILAFCSFLLASATLCVGNSPIQTGVAHIFEADTTLGPVVKTISTTGQFSLFDKDNPNRAFIKDGYGMSLNLILGQPEMDCFLANHAKDNLSFIYEIHESKTSGEKRQNLVTRIVSLKSGDDTRNWAQKEATDSTTQARHHEVLAKLRAGRQ